MGHLRLGTLPKTRPWRKVMGLLDHDPGDVSTIASATIQAAGAELDKLRSEPSLGYCFWLLTRITWSARQPDFASRLHDLGIDLAGSVSALSFVSAVSDHARRQCATYRGSTAFRDIANGALKQALSQTIGTGTPSLFGSTLADVQAACRRYSSRQQFGLLARHFFSIFTDRSLRYFIDKELSNHIGPGSRLQSIDDGRDFSDALETYAWQTSKIVEEFAAGWYSKHNWQSEGDISEADARRFVAYGLRKFQMELEREEKAR